MKHKIQKLKKMVQKYLYKTKSEILLNMGQPSKESDHETWFYNRYHWLIFKDEITFFFEYEKVSEIIITESILKKEIRIMYYYKGKKPEYKMINLLD